MIKNKWLKLFVLNIFFLMMISVFLRCSYNKPNDILPDDIEVTYTNDIKPIITSNCIRCHSATATHPDRNTNVFFDSYEDLKFYALQNSKINEAYKTLVARLRHIEKPGMPYKEPKLADIEILKIEAWIRANVPE